MSKGTPKFGDRSARQIKGWPDLHADDIEDGTHEYHTPLSVYDKVAAPGVGDDSGDGYEPGSRWVDVTADKYYVCLDATLGAAIWLEVGAAGGSGHTIQDEGSDMTARANLNFVGDGVTVTDDAGNNATVVTIPGGGGSTPPALKVYMNTNFR